MKEPVRIGVLIDSFLESHGQKKIYNKFQNEPTITELREKNNEYRVPFSEISIWEENGWKFNAEKWQMERRNEEIKIKSLI